MSEVIIKIKAAGKGAKDTIGDLADQTRRGFRDMEQSGNRLQRSWAALKKNWLATTAAIGGSLYTLKRAWDSAFDAARFQQMRQSFHTFAASHGADSNVIIANLKRVSANTIATAELMEIAGNAMLLGIPADKLTRLMEIARASSRITGRTIAESFNDIALGLGRQSKLILDNLGIIVKVDEANAAYADTLGKQASQLTDVEKKQAFFNAVLAAGEDTMRRVNVQATTQAEKMQALTAQWKDVGVAIGGVILRAGLLITATFQETAALGTRLFGIYARFAQVLGWVTDAFRLSSGNAQFWSDEAERAAGVANELSIKANESFEAMLNYGKLEDPIHGVTRGLKDASAAAGDVTEQSKEAIDGQIKGYREVQSALEKHIEEARSAYKTYSDEIIALEKEIKRERMTTEEIIRDLRQSLLDPTALHYDRQLEAEEQLSRAREALAREDFETARSYTEKARSLYADLGREVKDGEEVIVSQARAVEDAIAGVTGAEELLEQILQSQIDKKEAARDALVSPIEEGERALDDLTAKLEELEGAATTHTVEIDDDAALAAIEVLKQNTSSTHTIFIREVQARRHGGPIRARSGRHLPGYGGGDRIPVMAEAGEYVVRKEAVRHYGRAVFDSLNRMTAESILSRMAVPAFANGGLVPTGASGGTASASREIGTVNLTLDGRTYPLQAESDVFRTLSERVGGIRASRGSYRPPWER